MKIIYFGSSSALSLIPLKTLIQSHHTLSAVIINADINSDFNVISPNTIKSLAYNNSIPVLNYNDQSTNLSSQLSSIQADLIIVSCFAYRISSNLLAMAKYGGINIHPSELPLYRGPDPLFWQYREGVNKFGVTLHRITEEFDAGNIVAQKLVKLADGLSIQDATQKIADESCDLLISALTEIADNKIHELEQNHEKATYQSFPTKNDFTVSTSWTAQRIYNFINAYKTENITFLCNLYGKEVRIANVKSYTTIPYPGMNGKEILYKNRVVIFACADGCIECELKDD